MHIHILGICGTFMGGIAAIAKQAGHTVTGCDANVYPPMSTQLEAMGIRLIEGWDPKQIDLKPDLFVVGNVVSRGNPLMEAILNRGLAYGAKGERTELRTDLARTRQVFFSHWAAKAVATAIVRDPKILPELTFHATGRPARSDVLALVTPGGRTFRVAMGLRF